MEKILNTKGLGVSGRQNELIELALTFKFNSVEVDMNDLIGRHDTMGKEFACQFLQSAKINIGTFELPVDLDSADADFNTACEKLDTIFSLCETLGGKRCRVAISTSSESAFQENFERHRSRLFDLGEKFAAKDMSIGLMLQSPGANEKSNKFIQTAEEILTLVKTVGHDNVGLCLDTWQWRASGGGMDQISEFNAAKVTELAMADLPESADPANLTGGDRTLPGDSETSFSLDVFKQVQSSGYAGPISFATHAATYSNVSRDLIVNRISSRLDKMIAGEPLEAPVAPAVEEKPEEEAAAEAAPADAKDAKESKETVATTE